MVGRPLILASASPARLGLLQRAGIDPIVRVSGVDEDAVAAALGPHADAAMVCEALAVAKAEAVVADVRRTGDLPSDVLVLGCDSVFDFEGEILGKPHTADVALARMRRMSGKSGVLRTGHALVDVAAGITVSGTVSTEVKFSVMTEDEMQAYVATGEPLAVAGGFTLDGYGAPYLDGVVGDPLNVIGLSLRFLRELLQRVG